MKKVCCIIASMFLSLAAFPVNNFYLTYGTGFSSTASSISFTYSISSPDLSTSTESGGRFYGRVIFSGAGGNHYVKSFVHGFNWNSSGITVREPLTYTEVPNDRLPPSSSPLTTGSTTVTVPVNTACLPNGTYTVFLELYGDWPIGVELPHNALLNFTVGSTTTNYDNAILYHAHPSGLLIDNINQSLLNSDVPIASGAIGTFTVSSGSSFSGSTSITPGNCTTLPVINITTTGGASPYTLYYRNGSSTSGSMSSASSSMSLPGLTHGTYNLALVDANGCRRDYTTTTVKPTTSVTVTPGNQTICKNKCIQLSASATGGSGFTYSWEHSKPGTAPYTIYSGQSFSTIPPSPTAPAVTISNTYTATASNAYCTGSASTVQTVNRTCSSNEFCFIRSKDNNMRIAEREGGISFADTKLGLYPNPAANFLNIRFGELEAENAHIEVYDVMGKLLKRHAVVVGTVSMEMDISTLPQGLYLLRVVTS
ncbi:MAG: T9SS type A sorting domain-containing protein, partial [Chitinophagaceae bacterium]|nr:T9SS type A sorting domain-containing protein [Chitinophagaceae bacterium]